MSVPYYRIRDLVRAARWRLAIDELAVSLDRLKDEAVNLPGAGEKKPTERNL